MSTITAEAAGTQRGRADGPWHVWYEPLPIPIRTQDWAYVHEDYDGAPDSADRRCGRAESEAACRLAIEELEQEAADTDEAAREDRLFIDSCRRMSESELRDVVASMHRHDGPIYDWCREQAAGILAERFGVTPDEDDDEWERERAAQAAWAEGQAAGALAETDDE